MTDYTISGAIFHPNGADPLAGNWYVSCWSDMGAALRGTDVLANTTLVPVDANTGNASEMFPGTTGDQIYMCYFQSTDRKTVLGRYFFTLTSNTTWSAIMTAPSALPADASDALIQLAAHINNATGAHAATAISTANGSNVEVQLGLKATTSALTTETAARIAGDAASVSTAASDATTKANAAQTAAISAAASDATTKVGAEATTRATADTTLQTNITNEATARANADALLAPQATTYTKTETDASRVGRVEAASYTYNADSTVATETVGGAVTTYAYNGDGTVHTATRNGVTMTYTYDGSGNVTAVA